MVRAGSASATQSYAGAGIYSVAITVTDDDGGAAQSRFQYVVVYDPSAGFVTGGGNSPVPRHFGHGARRVKNSRNRFRMRPLP